MKWKRDNMLYYDKLSKDIQSNVGAYKEYISF